MDPDQTAPRGAVWSGSTLFAKVTFKSHADDKADDNYCDWQFKVNVVDMIHRVDNVCHSL